MLRRFCGNSWGTFSQNEVAVVQEMAASHEQLLSDGGVTDVRSEAGYAACAVFLASVDKVSRTFCLEVAPRSYRTNFTANYRALFPDNARHYRVDVFEASVDQHSAIWVNGDKFELSKEAISYAEALQLAWSELGALLIRWRANKGPDASTRPTRAEVGASLVGLDMAWAQFECKYISELIAIEEQARQFIVKAVAWEQQIRNTPQGTAPAVEAEKTLVQCIAHLNSVANFKRKGRDDLNYNILESSRVVLERCEKNLISGAAQDAARILASDVVSAYDAMRHYLCEVSTCIERVDPHLCNNTGLVARLVDWEESWEIGLRYIQEADMFEAVIDIVAEFNNAQILVPALTTMCEDCDVELFLVLPRIVLLSYMANPSRQCMALVRSLIPHRFGLGKDETVKQHGPGAPDAELETLVDHFHEAACALEGKLLSSAPVSNKSDAWKLFIKRAVLGGSEAKEVFGDRPLQSQKVVEDLMRDVEKWSLELQRHCPEDWNQFSAVLVQCLTGGTPKDAAAQFEV